MDTERTYTVRVGMTAGGCLAYMTCAWQSKVILQLSAGWRIVLAGLAGAGISLAVNAVVYYVEKRLSGERAVFQPFWPYLNAKNIKRKLRLYVAGGVAAALAMLMSEFVYSPGMNPAVQIFAGVLIGLAVGLLVEYSLKTDAVANQPVSNQAK